MSLGNCPNCAKISSPNFAQTSPKFHPKLRQNFTPPPNGKTIRNAFFTQTSPKFHPNFATNSPKIHFCKKPKFTKNSPAKKCTFSHAYTYMYVFTYVCGILCVSLHVWIFIYIYICVCVHMYWFNHSLLGTRWAQVPRHKVGTSAQVKLQWHIHQRWHQRPVHHRLKSHAY